MRRLSPLARLRSDPELLVALGLYLLAVAALRPWELDFPLNDDWVYTLAVRNLVQEGRLRYCDWATASQLVQVLWGALWTALGGWHLGVLRMSTVALAGLALLALNLGLAQLDWPSGLRLSALLLLAANPLFFCLSLSFMTDVPFLSLMLLACALYLKAERTGSHSWLVWGSLAAAGAALIRQTGLLIPAGYVVHLALQRRLDLRRAAALIGIPLVLFGFYELWYHFVHGPTWASQHMMATSTLRYWSQPRAAATELVRRVLGAVFLLGLLGLPLLLGVLSATGHAHASAASPRRVRLLAAAVGLLGVLFLAWQGWMPHLQNTLHRAGLGAVTVADSEAKAAGFFGWSASWAIVSSLALASVLLATLVVRNPWTAATPLEKAALHIYLTSALVQLAPALLRDRFFDRYLLILVPGTLLAVGLAARGRGFRPWPACVAASCLALVSFAGTQDYLAWNRAKWQAGGIAVTLGLRPAEIANGFDWNGYWTFEQNMAFLKAHKPLDAIGEWEWQALNPYQAITSFKADLPEWTPVGRAPYRTLLSSREQQVTVFAAPAVAARLKPR